MGEEIKYEKTYPLGYEPEKTPTTSDPNIRNQLIDFILKSGPTEVIDTDLFAVMAKRRSTRKFSDKPVQPSHQRDSCHKYGRHANGY